MTAEGSPGREDSAAASEAEDAAESGANGSQSSQGGDARLRDAVAAWVAGAGAGAEGAGSDSSSGDRESRAEAESDGDVEGDEDAAPSADDGTAPEAEVDAEEARTDSEADSGSEPEDAVAAEGASGTVEAKDDRPVGDVEAEAAEDADEPLGEETPVAGGGSDADEPEADASSSAVADQEAGAAAGGDAEEDHPAGSSEAEAAEDAERSEVKPEDGADARSDAEPSGDDTPAGSRGSGADEPEADAVSGADGDASGEDVSADAEDDAPAGGSGAEPSAEDAVAGGRSDDEDEPKADATPGGGAASGTGAESGSSVVVDGATADAEDDHSAGGPDADSSAEEAPAPGRTADADEPKDATPSGEAAPASGADAESESESGRDGDAESGSATGPGPDAKRDPRVSSGNVPAAERDDEGEPEPSSSAGEDEPKRPVDQPTATFKVRAPAVDQPTTTLKVGDAKPDEKPAGTEPDDKPDEKSATPERDAERTSKFVALKPLDEPAPPKEKPTVPPAAETAAIPQVGPEQTAQQPLPPKPPIDLLAELTNTPPPPETPVRTIVRRVKIWTPLAILLAVVFAVVQAVRPLPTPTLALTADETYTFEGDKVTLPWPGEGQGWMDVNGVGTVDNFGKQQPVAIGSVAKAMVAYVILKDHPLKSGEEGKNIPVDAKAETEGGYDKDGESTLNTIKKGDTLTQRQALAAIMIPSANNVARLLARWDSGGDEAAFVKKMNDAAADLGMKNTKYTDPSGLKETTVSTAEDQVKLGNELVRMKALTDITKLPTWKDPSGKKWQNFNRLVPYDNAIGIKTGSTTKAGGNLLFAATEDVDGEIVTVVGAILGQHKPPIIDTVNAVSKTAMVAAQDALTSSKILKKGDVVGYVDDGFGGRARVVATKDVSAVGWAGKTVELTLSDDGTEIPHEAKAGTKVGSLSVGDGTGAAVEVPVALQSDLTEPGYGSKLTRVS
ncbi:D-alanyl-D-alanine carboxypeptidase [Streptomyces flaveus]|uniref:D-alanyl-D-alanine carboxypeptidase n=1 Tax=Streptomyces flaveus TaxID=66370 RepID=UPI003320A213